MVFAITFVVNGYNYNAHQDIWKAEIDSELPCLPEQDNRDGIFQWCIHNLTDKLLLDFYETTHILLSVLAVSQ